MLVTSKFHHFESLVQIDNMEILLQKCIDRPQYLLVCRQTLDTIEVDIKDNTGDSISFLRGEVAVKLNFRQETAISLFLLIKMKSGNPYAESKCHFQLCIVATLDLISIWREGTLHSLKAMSFAGRKIWNSLPAATKNSQSLKIFNLKYSR